MEFGAGKSLRSKRLFGALGNLRKAQVSRKEAGYRHLVCSIEHDWRRTSRLQGLARKTQGRKSSQVRRFEIEPRNCREIELLCGRFHPLRPGERISDWDPHVWRPKLCEH